YDLSLEWYNRPGGAFAIAVYQKDIQGYVGPITDRRVLCPANGIYNGIDFGLGALQDDGTNCNIVGSPTGARVTASGVT
ncbi:hypothetical protein, partial [Enterobacter cloacae]